MAATNTAKAAAAKNNVVADASDIVEDVKELVEDSVELVKKTWIVRSNPKVLMATASLAGVVIGGALTYLIVSKRISSKWQKIADEQVESVKAHYSILKKDGPENDLEVLAAQYAKDDLDNVDHIVTEEGYTPYDKVLPTTEPPSIPIAGGTLKIVEDAKIVADSVKRNIFESDNPDTYFDFEEEIAKRNENPDKPYLLTRDEFDQGEADFTQTQLTYFEDDDVLVDDKNQVVDDDIIDGGVTLLRFGHGSGDPNIVYIRSPQLELDFEVTHSDESYAKKVLGFDDGQSLRHSDRRTYRKFRDSDE